MKKIFYLIVILLLVSLGAWGHEPTKLDRSFSNIKKVELTLASGDCRVRVGSGDAVKVHLEYTYPSDRYTPEMESQGDRLVIKEKFEHSFFGGVEGSANWKLEVPKNTAIEFSIASGDLGLEGISGAVSGKVASGDIKLAGISGECKIKAASGDIELENISAPVSVATASGDINGRRIQAEKIEMATASGDIELSECRGAFEVKAASGDINVNVVEISGASNFKAASGDVAVLLAKSPAFDLMLASASGDVCLNYNGQPLQGYFECMVKKESGDIESSVSFEKQEEVMEHGQVYVKKTFTRKSSTPSILLRTASGTIELNER